MDESLQIAIDCLKIRDVYLSSSHSSLESDFDPKYEDLDKIEIQFKHVVARSSVMELTEEDDKSTINLFRVFIELGARWISPSLESEKPDDSQVKAYIEGVMVAEYLIESDPGPEALKQFALKNASYHVWPYWREYLTTQCLRMNLPKFVMPAVQFSSNHDDE